jgi:uncharacterized membrane protein
LRVQPTPPLSHPSTKIALIASFAGLSLGTNYALIGLTNVKLMDALVFVAAFLFGLRVGTGVAVSTWAVYGFLNPYGPDDLILLSFLILGECFYAFAGSLLRRTSLADELLADSRPYARFSIVFGTVGILSTLAYDILTNFASWLFKTTSLYNSLVIGVLTGAPFAFVHEISNVVIFATAAPAAIAAARRLSPNTTVRGTISRSQEAR